MAKLIEVGASVDSRHRLGSTALLEAVQGGHKGVALERLAAGADVNRILDISCCDRMCWASSPYRYFTPLVISVEGNDEGMVKILQKAGSDPTKGPAYAKTTPHCRKIRILRDSKRSSFGRS